MKAWQLLEGPMITMLKDTSLGPTFGSNVFLKKFEFLTVNGWVRKRPNVKNIKYIF